MTSRDCDRELSYVTENDDEESARARESKQGSLCSRDNEDARRMVYGS